MSNIGHLNDANIKKKKTLPNSIKHKINKRKKLLKQRKRTPSNELKQKLNSLNAEIKTYYFSEKRSAVRKDIMPDNSRSLWSAVNTAKGAMV